MTDQGTWETEGARARPPRPGDDVPTPIALRAMTWIGTLLALIALALFVATSFSTNVGLLLLLGTLVAISALATFIARLGFGLLVDMLAQRR